MTTTPITANDPNIDPDVAATSELAYELAEVLTGRAAVELLNEILADDVCYLAPGRGPGAGLHRGIESVVASLLLPGRSDVQVDRTELTELLVTGDRALVIVETSGRDDASGGDCADFAYETAFHLQCLAGRIVGITEYSGDQYLADGLAAPAERGER
jgi:ketosteroid isomerase-like protein